ncbi:MAG: hypothetical protein RR636_14780 [Clostridium sp.]|uniref:hypothetical protein n=1 Tax=Clostridium sp. TaxID=1506 RepID=UPI0030609F9D
MNKLKNPKLPFQVGSIFVTIIELIVIAAVFPHYEGVISYGSFIALVLMQPIWYFNLTNSKSKNYSTKRVKVATLIIIITSIFIPIFMYVAIPKYTYNDGVNILNNHIQNDKNNEFLIDDTFRSTISVTGLHREFPKNILMNNKFYLYLTVNEGESKNYALDPLTGEILELDRNYTNYY